MQPEIFHTPYKVAMQAGQGQTVAPYLRVHLEFLKEEACPRTGLLESTAQPGCVEWDLRSKMTEANVDSIAQLMLPLPSSYLFQLARTPESAVWKEMV